VGGRCAHAGDLLVAWNGAAVPAKPLFDQLLPPGRPSMPRSTQTVKTRILVAMIVIVVVAACLLLWLIWYYRPTMEYAY
jgi:hypothetical protein